MSRACIRVIALLVQIVLLAGVVTGCGSRSSVVKKSRAQLAAMEDQANAARQCVWAGHCHEAIATFENLVREQHVSQPLYQMELAVACLAAGEDEKAFRALRAAQVSVEWLFDEASEKKAASLWGGESEKVYKGEAHERCSLFFLLGLMMLERGETDNALACFKSALLQDSDVEKDQYKSDYGLLHLMAAKCYELRDESEQRDQHVRAAIRSYASCHPDAQAAVSALYKAQNLAKGQTLASVANELVRAYGDEAGGLHTVEDVETFANAKLAQIADTDYFKPLLEPFNTLLVVWAGTPPSFIRTGRYGEQRMVLPGMLPVPSFEVWVSGTGYGCIRGFGSVSYQATTRGGRLMDNVLAGQAQAKGFAQDTGDTLITAAGQTDDPAAALILLVLGLIGKGFGAAMTVEADVRAWQTLPHDFQVAPLQLAPGEYDMRLCAYRYASPLCTRALRVTIDGERPLSVVHAFAYEFGKDAVPEVFDLPQETFCALQMGQRSYRGLDADGNGEVSAAELDSAYRLFLAMYDGNKNGKVEPLELSSAQRQVAVEFRKGVLER